MSVFPGSAGVSGPRDGEAARQTGRGAVRGADVASAPPVVGRVPRREEGRGSPRRFRTAAGAQGRAADFCDPFEQGASCLSPEALCHVCFFAVRET